MLSRRHLLIGSGCALAALAPPARSEPTSDGILVLRATPQGFGGAVPGPVIRLQRGEEAKIRLVNLLDEPTAIHWHGVRVPNPMDGAPPLTQAPVGPGESFDYRFRVPDSGTFWYRSAVRHQLGRGLFGALIVDEVVPPAADLDQVLVFAEIASGGAEEPRPTLNGATSVEIAVRPNARLRLRFINACNSAGDGCPYRRPPGIRDRP